VEKDCFDVVLMDVQMPELDGVEATRRIRQLPPPRNRVPIIALTAHAMAGAQQKYLDAGMDDYLSKPIKPAALLAKLTEFAAAPPPIPWPTREETAGGSARFEAEAVDLDCGQLAALQSVMKAQDLRALVEMFIAATAATAARLRDLSAAGDIEALQCEAHTAIGTAGNVGAMRLSSLARAIEAACKVAPTDPSLTALVDQFAAAITVADPKMRAWLDHHLA
jgi:CheY-like chemotaxis protein